MSAPAPLHDPIVGVDGLVTWPWVEWFRAFSDKPLPITSMFNDPQGLLTQPWVEWLLSVQAVPWPPKAQVVYPGDRPGLLSPVAGNMATPPFLEYLRNLTPVTAPIIPGRFVTVGGSYWCRNAGAGTPGFDGPAGVPADAWLADSTFALGKLIEWLCGKTTGATVLLNAPAVPATFYDTKFRGAIATLGHTLTVSGQTLTFGGYEPLNFDVLIMYAILDNVTDYHGYTDRVEKWDYVLANNGHILTSYTSFLGDPVHNPYGINDGTLFHSGHAPSRRPVTGGLAYPAGTLYFPVFTDERITTTTNTHGGTNAVDYCDTHPTEGVLGYWYS